MKKLLAVLAILSAFAFSSCRSNTRCVSLLDFSNKSYNYEDTSAVAFLKAQKASIESEIEILNFSVSHGFGLPGPYESGNPDLIRIHLNRYNYNISNYNESFGRNEVMIKLANEDNRITLIGAI